MKKILFVASEALPFASSGGLGDVIGSLPAAIAAASAGDCDVRVVLPLYGTMEEKYRAELTFVQSITVALAWRKQYCGIFTCVRDGVTYYFVDNEYYFKRGSLYGQYDDGERYAFFCKAALELLPVVGFMPDVLHAHDWQSALTVVYLKYKYGLTPGYAEIKTVFTIHNIAYQGVYGFDILGDVFELTERESSVLDYSGSINLMKGAIVCADAVTTVSPTYAREILSPKFSGGLHHVLELHKGKLRGILNGIDTSYYDPANDPELFAAYSAEDPAGKAVNKAELQRMLSLPESPDTPLFAIVSRLADHKGLDLVALAADDILEGDVQLIVLGKGEYYYENFFYHLAQRYPNKVSALLVYNKDLSKKVYAGADMFLMPSKTEPCGLAQMIASRYGAVPIVRETGGLYDSIRDCGWPEGGNGFTFAPYSAWELLGAVRRAEKMYTEQPEQWRALRHTAMTCDFTWNRSALQYIELYGELN